MHHWCALTIVLVLHLTGRPAAAAIRYVDATATGAADGSSWSDAFPDLQPALAAAIDGDQIWVAAGTYAPSSTADAQATFSLVEGVELYGGFAGHEGQVNDRNWLSNQTILSGDLGLEPAAGQVSEFVVSAVDTDSTTVIDGLWIRDGRHGLLVDGGNPVVRRCVITGNTTWGGGDGAGATLRNGARPLFHWTVFTDNHALEGSGGGIAAFDSQPRLEGCDLSENTAALRGGGMLGDGEFLDVDIRYNHADEDGGGLYGGGRLEDVLFHSNSSTLGTAGMVGRGELTGCLFLQNQGDTVASCTGAGGALRGGGTLIGVLFAGNSHGCNGGAMADPQGSSTIVNAAFAANEAGLFDGGALWLDGGGTTTLVNSSFTQNSAGDEGGAIRIVTADLDVANSILWNDSADFGPEIAADAGTLTFSHSLVQGTGGSGAWSPPFGGTDLGGNLDLDPLFETPSSPGLTARSPAIDAGDDTAIPAGVTEDLAGRDRILRAHVDMGAFEYDGPLSLLDPPPGPVSRRQLWNAPNPFNPSTTIYFGLAESGSVELAIFDLAGRRVRTLVSATLPAGDHEVEWRGRDDAGRRVASGVYVCRLRTPTRVHTHRLALVE